MSVTIWQCHSQMMAAGQKVCVISLSLLIIHTDVTRSVSCHAQLGGRVSLLCPDVGRSKELWAGPNMNMCPSRVLSVRGKAIHASLLHKKCPYKTLAMSVSHFNVGVTVWIWHNLLHSTHGPDHKMHSIRSGYCSMYLVPAVANIRDHLVSQCSNKIRSRQMVSQDSVTQYLSDD